MIRSIHEAVLKLVLPGRCVVFVDLGSLNDALRRHRDLSRCVVHVFLRLNLVEVPFLIGSVQLVVPAAFCLVQRKDSIQLHVVNVGSWNLVVRIVQLGGGVR